MAVMMGKLYAALRAGNVPEAQAREAAEEMAGYENRFAKIESDLLLVKWMLGTLVAINLAGFGKLIFGH